MTWGRFLSVLVMATVSSVCLAQGSRSQLQQLNVDVLHTATTLAKLTGELQSGQESSFQVVVEAASIQADCNSLGRRLTQVLGLIQADLTKASQSGKPVQPYFDVFDYAKSLTYQVIAMRYEAGLIGKGQALAVNGQGKSDLFQLAEVVLNESQLVSDLVRHEPDVTQLVSRY